MRNHIRSDAGIVQPVSHLPFVELAIAASLLVSGISASGAPAASACELAEVLLGIINDMP